MVRHVSYNINDTIRIVCYIAPLNSQVEVVDGGVMESRRHLNVRGKSATLPAITEKDWLDLKFGVEAGVDAFALSFVKVRHGPA